MIERRLHEWQYGVEYGRDYRRASGYYLRVFCVWIKFIPMRGELIRRQDYHGFIWEIRTPHARTVRQVINPLARYGFGHAVYLIPTSFSF